MIPSDDEKMLVPALENPSGPEHVPASTIIPKLRI
jgi:hypothetical protein